MNHMQYEFRLFGGRAGQTVVINGHKFVQGIYHKVVAPVQASTLIKVLGYYGAHPKGSPAYDAALAKEQELGTDEVHSGAQCGPAAAVSDAGGSAGAGPAASGSSDERDGAAAASADGSRDNSPGDGHADAGVPKFEDGPLPQPFEPASVGSRDIKTAMMKLDPENDDHWVKAGVAAGKPKLHAVETAYGRAGLTRDDLEDALPGWTRDKAIEHMLES